MDLFVIDDLFRDTPVVFQKVQNWWITRLFCTQIHSPARAHSTLCFMSTSLRTLWLKMKVLDIKSPRILIVIHLVLPCRCSTSPSFLFLHNTRPPAPHSPGPQRQLRHTRGVGKQPHKARPQPGKSLADSPTPSRAHIQYIFHWGTSLNFPSLFVSGRIPGGQENDRARQAVLCTILKPFGNDQEEKNLMMITLFLERYITKHIVNAIKMRFIGSQ